MTAKPLRMAALGMVMSLLAMAGASAQTRHDCQSGNCANGYGTSRYDGDLGNFVYSGNFSDGRFHGQGRIVSDDGSVFEGRFESGMPVNGRLEDTDGSVYQGDLADWELNGRGTMTYENGDVYTGQWDDGYREGTGTLTAAAGASFTGEWSYDEPLEGVAAYADGHVYSGGFLYGEYSGEGRMIYPDGSVYDGAWVAGGRSGQGTYTGTTGAKFEGEWEYDHPSEGVMTLPDGTVYTGGFDNDVFEGQGKITYPDGMTYEGGWAVGKRVGEGRAVFPDGLVFEGDWAEDLPVSGTLTETGAEPRPARFENGQFVWADVAGE